MVRCMLILLLSATWIAAGCPSWLMEDSARTMLTYHFFHANFFHLAVNCLAIWCMFPPKRKGNLAQLAAGLAISVLVFPFHVRPIVGISNMIFAVAGMRTPPFSSPWWRSQNAVVYIGTMFLMLALPQFSAVTHIVSFAAGILTACAARHYKKIRAYADRYIR